MKSTVTIFVLALFCINVFSQAEINPYLKYSDPHKMNSPRTYIGFSTGINNMVGILGITLDQEVNKNFTMGVGIGLSTWGYKWELNVQYYPKGWPGLYIKGGYSRNTGLVGFETEMELDNGSNQYVMMDLEPVGNIFFTAGHAWKLGKKNKFYLEGGYALPLVTDDYYSLCDNSVNLSSTSEQVMRILRPGGLVVAIGFNISL